MSYRNGVYNQSWQDIWLERTWNENRTIDSLFRVENFKFQLIQCSKKLKAHLLLNIYETRFSLIWLTINILLGNFRSIKTINFFFDFSSHNMLYWYSSVRSFHTLLYSTDRLNFHFIIYVCLSKNVAYIERDKHNTIWIFKSNEHLSKRHIPSLFCS